MKKITLMVAAIATIFTLHSCLEAGENEYHQTYFYPTSSMGFEMYADEVKDTVLVISYDSWTATLDGSWMSISPKSQEVPQGYYYTTPMAIATTPNTTGITRTATIKLDIAYEGISTLGMPVYQYGWLNISIPTPTYTSTDVTKARALFGEKIGKTAKSAKLVFTTHGRTTLASDAEWLPIPKEYQNLDAGYHAFLFDVTANNTGSDRDAHIIVTSNTVSDTITYRQLGTE